MISDITFTRFNLEIPKQMMLSVISQKYPDLVFNILSLLPLGQEIGSCSLQIKGKSMMHDREKVLEDMQKFNLKTIILGNIPGYILLNLQIGDPWFLQTIIRLELMLHYPLQIRNGIISLQLIANRMKIDHLFSELDKNKIDYDLREITFYRPAHLLTPKQDNVLTDALKLGYYEIPRNISLSELAKKYKISPSALSGTFRRIEKKLGNDYLKRKNDQKV
jgi:predicted DNA binding protein